MTIWVKGLVGIVCLHLLLTMPNRLSAFSVGAFLDVPVALPVVIAGLALVTPRMQGLVRHLLLLLLGALLLLKVADMAAIAFQGRIFDPLTEWRILGPAWNVLSHSLGPARLAALSAAGVLGLAVALSALWWSLLQVSRLVASALAPRRAPVIVVAAVGVLAGVSAAAGGWKSPYGAPVVALVSGHVRTAVQNARSLDALMQTAATDPVDHIPENALLAKLEDKDVALIFVESYGQTVLANPLYAPRITRRLAASEDAVAAAGLKARSAWLTAPTVGGQSWLAHATLVSGLWIDSQQDYDWLMTSQRTTLNRLFRQAGWRTIAVMPAITEPWPEGAYYGYDTIYCAMNMGYRGAPFNWVTMPDQYVLSFVQRRELSSDEDRPVMAEFALISSHAPWVPIPPVLDWDAVGDGSVFTPYANSGDPPSVVWSDPERVREQYLKAIDYSLATLASFVRAYAGHDLVLVILGDHQSATIVTGPDATRNVPAHIITADEAVLEAAGAWGWTAGMVPDERSAHWRMDRFREHFVIGMSSVPDTLSGP